VVASEACRPCAGDDAADVAWMPVAGLPKLASDHNLILDTAIEYLRLLARARKGDLGLLPSSVSKEDFLDALDAVPAM